MSQGNYTAWFYRRKLIDLLKLPLKAEMVWLQSGVGIAYEKNYQIWHHRRCIAEQLDADFDTESERQFMMKIFASDSKNYHAW